MNMQIDEILKTNNLSVTDSRKKILGLFLSSQGALAHADIERNAERSATSLAEAGKWIGVFERILVLTFVIYNHFEGIGFLIAAKSILRFNDIKGDNTRKEAEYVLIGTLMSFASSIVIGIFVTLLMN